jgi:hypothetical protein
MADTKTIKKLKPRDNVDELSDEDSKTASKGGAKNENNAKKKVVLFK